MASMICRLVLFAVLAGAGLAALARPVSAFYGSFWTSCDGVHIHGARRMSAWCRRPDGGWTRTSIGNCGGRGVRNDAGTLVCGTE